MEGNIRIYRLLKGRGMDQWKWYCPSRRREKYLFHGPYHDPSISATQSVSRNSEGHMESVQPIKCMLFILIFNKFVLYLNTIDYAYICSE